MDGAGLAARLLLAAVFVVAAGVKAADRRVWRAGVSAFGVPDGMAPLVAFVVPFVELAVAGLLVAARTATVGAVGALVVLALFVAGIVANLAKGRRPDCNCFGQVHARPIGPGILVRDALLMGLAGLVLAAGGGESVGGWWDGLTHTDHVGVVLGGVAAVQLVLVWNVFVRYGRLLVRVDELAARVPEGDQSGAVPTAPMGAYGLAVGSPAPAFELAGLFGERMTLAALLGRGRPVVLLFTDPHCGPCGALTPEVAHWQRAYAATATVAVISRGIPEDNQAKFTAAGVADVFVQADDEVASAYRSSPTPSGVLIDTYGQIASPAAIGADALRRLVTETAGIPGVPVVIGEPNGNGNGNGNGHHHDHAPAPVASRVGEPIPPVRLPDLDGTFVDLKSMRGRDLLMVFWNPQCGFCSQFLPELRDWETGRDDTAPELVIVTTGSIEENRTLGFESTVLYDEQFATAPRFGVNGTPMGLLITRRGRIGSDVAIGAAAIMELTTTIPD